MADRIAQDGLVAREGGAYALLKHGWMEAYLSAALNATKTKIDRAYVDLFAGPGIAIDKHSNEETPAGALRALTATGGGSNVGSAFTEAHFVNLDPRHHAALQQRVSGASECRIPREHIHHWNGDANQMVTTVMQAIPQRGYAFVFADPETAGQLPWSTVSKLTAQDHRSVDLYLLFPWGMDVRRNLENNPDTMDAFFGTQEWRSIDAAFPTDAFRVERATALRNHYLDRLRTRWSFAFDPVKVNLRGDQNLYYMLFATNNPAGQRIAEGVSAAIAKRSPQIPLL